MFFTMFIQHSENSLQNLKLRWVQYGMLYFLHALIATAVKPLEYQVF